MPYTFNTENRPYVFLIARLRYQTRRNQLFVRAAALSSQARVVTGTMISEK